MAEELSSEERTAYGRDLKRSYEDFDNVWRNMERGRKEGFTKHFGMY